MDFHDTLRLRRSVRGYQPTPIPPTALERIYDAVRLAPSACNLQPFKFLLVQSPEKKAAVCACYKRGTWLAAAPLIVVALGNREAAWKRLDGTSAHVIDTAIACEHLVLAAAAEGLATCWICAFDQEAMHRTLGLEPEWEVVAMTPVGYPNDEPRPFTRKPVSELFQTV